MLFRSQSVSGTHLQQDKTCDDTEICTVRLTRVTTAYSFRSPSLPLSAHLKPGVDMTSVSRVILLARASTASFHCLSSD